MLIESIIVVVTEIIGVIAFAVSGAMTAIDRHLDLFGVIVLGVTTAVGGGVIRDILLGIIPPAMFKNYLYVTVATIVSVGVFLFAYFGNGNLQRHRALYEGVINVFDAIGLGIFAVTGVGTALTNGFADNGFLAVFVGTVTGVGGGMIRDVMAGQIPMVLHKRIYAIAAIGGATLYYFLSLSISSTVAMMAGIISVIAVRLLATHFRWKLPRA